MRSKTILPMKGLSGHTMLWGIYHLWGTAAIPAGTPGIAGARGNTTTCSVQGFLFQISMVVPFYYVFLSLYSWVVVLQSNFDPANYEWVEKYIHIGVHIFPVASAIYLWTIESFNSIGLQCWIASLPSGCGGSSGIECTRGPQNPQTMLWIFGGMPAIFFLVFPTVVMITLTYCVYLRKTRTENDVVCVMPVSMIAKQSAIYIGSLYWVYLPVFLYYGVNYFSEQKSYSIAVWVNLITNSMGIWFAIVYWYFSTEDGTDSSTDSDTPVPEKGGMMPPIGEESGNLQTLTKQSLTSSSTATTVSQSMSSRTSKRTSRASKRFSFNIFDGTHSSGYFSAFVFEGDSDDEEKDAAETKQWEQCQQMNSDR